MFKTIAIILGFTPVFFAAGGQKQQTSSKIASSVIVCDLDKALKTGEDAIRKKFGRRAFNSYKPYQIRTLNDSTFCISGTIRTDKGGSPTVYINKASCIVQSIKRYK